MSLDITLKRQRWISYDNCESHKADFEVVYECNITHNLNKMAEEAGIYEAMWRPEEIGVSRAGEIIPLLEQGLAILTGRPDFFKQFNPTNKWGSYEGLVQIVSEYLQACKQYPDAIIEVSR